MSEIFRGVRGVKLKPEIKAYIEAELRDYHQTKRDLIEAEGSRYKRCEEEKCLGGVQ
jgi:hypothetical protein